MPYKNPEKQAEYLESYNREYYSKHRKKLLAYRKKRTDRDREIWREWYKRKQDEIRRQKIDLGGIYRPFNKYS
ncbi:MAG: hypothetical protein KCHDKBKB_00594 [Elusimicrobia bacterium]|nr:hypothetical protein [Elusimicrobiota bacterium]